MTLEEYHSLPEVRREKDPRRQLQGAQSRAAGNSFETIIGEACEVYETERLAKIEKTPEPMAPIKNLGGGRFIANFEKKAQPDYKGVLRGGREVCFEAKYTDKDRIEQSRVTPKQTEALDLHTELGAICFVLVSFGFRDFFRIPWTTWQGMKERFGRKYVTAADLEEYRVRNAGGMLEFLTEVKRNERTGL